MLEARSRTLKAVACPVGDHGAVTSSRGSTANTWKGRHNSPSALPILIFAIASAACRPAPISIALQVWCCERLMFDWPRIFWLHFRTPFTQAQATFPKQLPPRLPGHHNVWESGSATWRRSSSTSVACSKVCSRPSTKRIPSADTVQRLSSSSTRSPSSPKTVSSREVWIPSLTRAR